MTVVMFRSRTIDTFAMKVDLALGRNLIFII